MRITSSRGGRAALLVLGLLLAFTAGFLTHRAGLHRYVRPLIAYAGGEAGGCSLGQSYAALDTRAFERVQNRLRNTSETIERTPNGMVCVRTQRGTYWVAPGNDLAYVLAEQEVRIYGDGEHRVQPGHIVLDCGPTSARSRVKRSMRAHSWSLQSSLSRPTSKHCDEPSRPRSHRAASGWCPWVSGTRWTLWR